MDSAEVHSLFVPRNRLQITQYDEFVRLRTLLQDTNLENRILARRPSAYETWKMEKEFADLGAARNVLNETLDQDVWDQNRHRFRREAACKNRARMLLSGGYGSSFREVISVDEEWPEENWANFGLLLLDAPFRERFHDKMRMRPVLVGQDTTEER